MSSGKDWVKWILVKVQMKKIALYFIFPGLICCNSPQTETKGRFAPKKYDIEYKHNMVFLSCKVNDTIRGNFIFDTGCYGMCYDSLFNSQHHFIDLNVPVLPYKNDSLAQEPSLKRQNLSFNDYSYSTYGAQIINLKSMDGRKVDGLIGWDLFYNKMVEFNFLESSLKVRHFKDTLVDASFTKIPLKQTQDGFLLQTKIKINEGLEISGDFLLDMGYSGKILLGHKITAKHKLEEKLHDILPLYSAYATVEGEGYRFAGRVKKLTFNDFTFNDVIVSCSAKEEPILEGSEFIGLLGMDILKRFDMIIDFKRNILYLKPNRQFDEKFTFVTKGLGFVDRTDISEGWEINSMLLDEETKKTGIKPGDLITHINNKDVRTLSYDSVMQAFKVISHIAELTIKHGETSRKVNLRTKEYLKK